MYEILPGSISQEENWKDSAHNHGNEHAVVWAMSMYFVWGNQLSQSSLLISGAQSSRARCPFVHGFIHLIN